MSTDAYFYGTMKALFFTILILFFSTVASAQITITGQVKDATLKEPIAGANVFIGNTSLITITDSDGKFSFNNVMQKKGEVIINASGYNHFVYSFEGTAGISAMLTPKAKELDAVTVSSYEKDGFKKWGRLYLNLFVGETPEAADCKIENTEVLKFRYNKATGLLEVFATDPLIIINKALGYRIDYTLADFSYNTKSRVLFYSGYPSFTALEGKERRLRKWQEARNDCYKGSLMHFMRSLYRNTITEEGFTVQQAELKQNSEKARIKQRMNVLLLQQQAAGNNINISDLYPADSSDYYFKVMAQPDSAFRFASQQLAADSFAYGIDSTTAGFYFNNYLLINYKGAKARTANNPHAPRMYSFVTLVRPESLEVFQNGSYYSSSNFFTTDYWAQHEKICRMLPFDFKFLK